MFVPKQTWQLVGSWLAAGNLGITFSSFINYSAFIDFLIDTTGVPLSAFHVNGHSAGAHVAGAIGLGYRERHDFKKILPRVTGLDPAAYIPDLNNIDDRIDPTDGAFVDIIHTDDGGAGITIQMGHADFFPNVNFHILLLL